MILENYLTKNSKYEFDIKRANNGVMAIESFKESNNEKKTSNIKIIIMDSEMPILNGF